ncbi:hypothetical protein AN189_12975 [Loktanella sp. 3ANDIMAR09]|uniref:hypothetical protein n=1 Tax=Loktanella sp. 3ANDIMAR09 TaxID=1225657 RepID=UPI0006FFB2B9|nr:hypothetical protein [Loktanella sp. 3ANDIMAR09]KQI67983.1 hypothetical protein AN189_12975 [Loktanella sp. 3ANDIMAR09]
MSWLNISVSPEDIFHALWEKPDALIQILANMAVDEVTQEKLIEGVVMEHSGSEAHERIAPFLRNLADALEEMERSL